MQKRLRPRGQMVDRSGSGGHRGSLLRASVKRLLPARRNVQLGCRQMGSTLMRLLQNCEGRVDRATMVPVPVPSLRFASHNSQLTTHNYNSQLTTHNSQLTTHNSQLATHNSQLTTISYGKAVGCGGIGGHHRLEAKASLTHIIVQIN